MRIMSLLIALTGDVDATIAGLTITDNLTTVDFQVVASIVKTILEFLILLYMHLVLCFLLLASPSY